MGQLKPNALKNTSFLGLYKCCELKYWQKNDQKWNTICRLKTVYDDYIIKWPLKHRIVLSIEKLRQKLSLEWYSSRAVLIGWVKNSLDAFAAPCYSRNRVFWGIWWLIQCIYCNIKVPIVKYCSTENWTVREGGFRSCTVCEVLAVCAVFGGAESSLKINDIFFCCSFDKVLFGDQGAASCVLEEHCYRSVFASFAFARYGWLVVARSQLFLPLFSLTRLSLLTPIGLALNQHLLSLLWFMPR